MVRDFGDGLGILAHSNNLLALGVSKPGFGSKLALTLSYKLLRFVVISQDRK